MVCPGELAAIEAEAASLISLSRAKLTTLRQRQSSADDIVDEAVVSLIDAAEASIVSAETLQVRVAGVVPHEGALRCSQSRVAKRMADGSRELVDALLAQAHKAHEVCWCAVCAPACASPHAPLQAVGRAAKAMRALPIAVRDLRDKLSTSC